MLPLDRFSWPGERVTLPAGAPLMKQACALTHVYHLDEGRVALGLTDDGSFTHRMGTVDGPCWVNATCAILQATPVVDALADTAVVVQRVPLDAFTKVLAALPDAVRCVLRDVARAHRQQTELAVSRLAKDAEARCAAWLLQHAEPVHSSPGALAVMLHQRKRQIAAQLGIAPETLSRILRQLRERSLISGSGRVLNVVDPNGLRALAGA